MNKYTLITGASNGIGLEFAKIFAKEGNNLILVARNKDKLEELSNDLKSKYKIDIICINKDLSKQGSAEELYNQIKDLNVIVTNLINNAGFATSGKFSDIDLDKEIEEINLNILTLTVLTKLYLKEMLKNNEGGILNVSSIAAFLPGPYMAVYYATKAYVLNFTEAIFNETKGSNIHITALCPGPTNTNFANRANINSKMFFSPEVTMSPTEVARIGYEGFLNNKMVVVTGVKNKLSSIFLKYLPVKLVMNIARRLQG